MDLYKKEGKLYPACNDKKAFFTSADHYRVYHLWSCQNVCDALSFLLDNICIIRRCTNLGPPGRNWWSFTSTDYRGYTLWSGQNVCDALSYLLDNIYIRFGNKLYRQIVGIPMDTNCAPLVADLFLFCYERDFMKYHERMVNQIYPPAT